MSILVIVVPAKAGTHNHRTSFAIDANPSKANSGVLVIDRRGVWIPAFAGTTG